MMQVENHTFASLQQDISISKQDAQYLIDAHNIRITAREGETLLSVTNERGPKELKLVDSYGDKLPISGTIIGHCTINNYLILFTTADSDSEGNMQQTDYIYRIDMSKKDPEVFVLYSGVGPESLNFSIEHPIEAITDYENENIQKVYWTDGLNQPRIINIKTNTTYKWNGAFDFVPTLKLAETISVTRDTSASGMFAAGVIQYAFTYYNKYSQESNIFYVSPLNYISHHDRGGSPEDVIALSFKIEVSYPDTNFDYLRIYSIHRTSHDAVPTCKRLQDISLKDLSNEVTVTYIDNGTSGDTVDPSSLLYKGGEEIMASSMTSKDGTLFLGNISFQRPSIQNIIVENGTTFKEHVKKEGNNNATTATQDVILPVTSSGPYKYSNGLDSYTAGFKNNEYYRLGIQAQYKNGKWSEPVFIKDYKVDSEQLYPKIVTDSKNKEATLQKVIIKNVLNTNQVEALYNAGYKRIRPVVVFPEMQDRNVLLQGIGCPTLYTNNSRDEDKKNDTYAQSSWFFRPQILAYNISDYTEKYSNYGGVPYGVHQTPIPYTNNDLEWYPKVIKSVEVQGSFNDNNQFRVDGNTFTFHSPDIVFDNSLWSRNLAGLKCRIVGVAQFTNTLSDIHLQTSSPTINGKCAGFIPRSSTRNKANGILAGLYYEDYMVDDNSSNQFGTYPYQWSPFKWMVYPWQKNGSLNNDINRPANTGIRSANLSKKIISNLRYSDTIWRPQSEYTELDIDSTTIPQLFSSNEVSIVKLGNYIYKGNIDTLLSPDEEEGLYFAFGILTSEVVDLGNGQTESYEAGPYSITSKDIDTPFSSEAFWKTWTVTQEGDESNSNIDQVLQSGLYRGVKSDGNKWEFKHIKDYKVSDIYTDLAVNKEPVRMKYKSTPHIVIKLEGDINAMRMLANISYDCVLPIIELYKDYDNKTAFGGQSDDAIKANKWLPAGEPVTLSPGTECEYSYIYGDTWFARYDCLKTYPFTFEDTNQIVEIGSFMLETRINIDGRYDRNRGQLDNTNMSPINFNLFNPVYSQRDNFFTYRILDDDYYKLNQFPNQITWSTQKTAGQDIDPWTTVTLASTFDMDGSKGQIRSLNIWGDTIYCFQDSEVSAIMFNSRVQIPTSDGVPIEISNNYKVDGKRTVLEGAGCINKFAICPTPTGLYFVDSVGGHFQAIGSNGLTDLSLSKGMITWLSKQKSTLWKPNDYTTRLFYDKGIKDIYIVTEKEALCYSEAIGEFVSYMSYENIPVMFNVTDKFYCIKNNYINQMFEGEYNYFFGEYKDYDITFVSNGKTSSGDMSTIDKVYTNLEFRADKWADELNSILSSESPFDYIRVWNEYQDTGEVLLLNKPNKPSPLKKKFRVWRIQIPRDAHNRRDRIRNTWCKIKLGSSPKYNNGNNSFIQLHDAAVQFAV